MFEGIKRLSGRKNLVFFDTEFYEVNGHTRLISIGLKNSYDEELYMISPDVEEITDICRNLEDDFVFKNVLAPAALRPEGMVVTEVKDWAELKKNIIEFCEPDPVFWAYCSAFDTVALKSCVFGRMIDAPEHWPYTTNDISLPLYFAGLRASKAFPPIGDEIPEHNALADTRNLKRMWDTLEEDARKGKFGEKSKTILDVLFATPR